MNFKLLSKFSLGFFFIVAMIGALLRAAYYFDLPFQYGHLVHAHSHVAFQGWVYTILFLLLTSQFLSSEQIERGKYKLQFVLTVVINITVLISFSLQGYGLYSIVFSTLFQILNYWFIYRFFKDVKATYHQLPISLKFVKSGLWLGVLSTTIPYGIGFASAKGLSGTELYHSLVYTFLHLQYNGWFLFVILGLFFYYLESANIDFSNLLAEKFYQLFLWAVIPAIALSLLGMTFYQWMLLFAIVAAVLQVIGLLCFIKLLRGTFKNVALNKNRWFLFFIRLFLVSFILKIVLQVCSLIPQLEELAFRNKSIVLAYLHLSLLGVITSLLFAQMIHLKWIAMRLASKLGLVLFVLGFISTEFILVINGLGYFFSYLPIIIGSFSMVMGVLLLLITQGTNNVTA